jgi:FeS assembly SUF system protein
MNLQRLPLPMDTLEASPAPPEQPAPAEQQTGAAPVQALTWEEIDNLKNQIVATLCTCFDPEIPVNIYELGLIYDIEIAPSAAVALRMTLTSPACPAAGSLPPEVERKVRAVPGVTSAKVDVVWDPPWDKGRMSEAAKLQLGIDD